MKVFLINCLQKNLKTLLVLILFILIPVICVFPFELWNGLDTNMSKHELITKMSEILEAYEVKEQSPQRVVIPLYPYIGGYENAPIAETVYFKTNLPLYHGNKSKYDTDAIMYFYNNKLLAIFVYWGATKDALVTAINREYGRTEKIYEETFDYTRYQVYQWSNNNKLIFLVPPNISVYSSRDFRSYCTIFVYRELFQTALNNVQREIENRRKEAEDRQRKINNGIKL